MMHIVVTVLGLLCHCVTRSMCRHLNLSLRADLNGVFVDETNYRCTRADRNIQLVERDKLVKFANWLAE